MGYKFKDGLMYRMPTHFGPACGPRQGPKGRNQFLGLDNTESEVRRVSVSFRTNGEQLEELIPEGVGLQLGREPVVTVTATYMKGLLWLAGRGYNTLGVSFPVVFNGKKDHAEGSFLIVLWENLADCILTGRDDLGFSKIYAEIPEPSIYQGKVHSTAGWLGFKFIDLTVDNIKQLTPEEVKSFPGIKGSVQLHYKYMPKTGAWGTADTAYVTSTPLKRTGSPSMVEAWKGDGIVKFHRATWEEMPTQYHIVNALQELAIKEYCGAYMVRTQGGKVDDLSHQHILE
jgi:hypothetical protein